MGKIAVHLYGHLRTFERTFKSFFDNIINVNKKDGWEIDIFIHTWDVFNITDPNVWHAKQNLFPNMSGKKLSDLDRLKMLDIYNPVRYKIDQDPGKPMGRYESVRRAMKLRFEYEEENNIQYDYYLTTRPDLYFLKPLRIQDYIKLYELQPNLKNIGMPEKINFCSCWYFRIPGNLPILDPRFPNESDLLWFGNYCSNKGFDPLIAFRENREIINVFIKYRFNMDFVLCREAIKNYDYYKLMTKSEIDQFNNTIQKLNSDNQRLQQQYITLQNDLN
ncbi:hypothetical protein C3I39_08870, partial [Campylobacter jejuni]